MKNKMLKRLNNFLNNATLKNKVYFACIHPINNILAYNVNFFRIEIILSGSINMLITTKRNKQMSIKLNAYDAISIPVKGWNYPIWDKPVKTLNLLFDKKTIGLSYIDWNGSKFTNIEKLQIPQHNDRLSLLITNFMTLNDFLYNQNTMHYLVQALISDIINAANNSQNKQVVTRPYTLCQQIKAYIDNNYAHELSREFIAIKFNISPNYVSHLFNLESNIKLIDYLNYIRLTNAKQKLNKSTIKIKTIANECGFKNCNYFCRLFKKQFGMSPSNYRTQKQYLEH